MTTSHSPEAMRLRMVLLLHRTLAECENFGARCEYSPRVMVLNAAFTAIQFVGSRSRLQWLHPEHPVTALLGRPHVDRPHVGQPHVDRPSEQLGADSQA